MSYSQAFISSGIVLLIAFTLSLLTDLPNDVGDYGLQEAILGALYGTALFVFMLILGRYLQPNSEQFRDIISMLSQFFGHFNWPMIILVSVMAGVSEELLFRGVIQSYLMKIASPWLAIFLSSLLFSLLHFYNRLYLLITFLFSLMIGYLYYMSQSLLLVMVLHAVYDIFAFASLVKYPRFFGFFVK